MTEYTLNDLNRELRKIAVLAAPDVPQESPEDWVRNIRAAVQERNRIREQIKLTDETARKALEQLRLSGEAATDYQRQLNDLSGELEEIAALAAPDVPQASPEDWVRNIRAAVQERDSARKLERSALEQFKTASETAFELERELEKAKRDVLFWRRIYKRAAESLELAVEELSKR